jgi:hypothetical protein
MEYPGRNPRLYLRRARAAKENRNKAAKTSKVERRCGADAGLKPPVMNVGDLLSERLL